MGTRKELCMKHQGGQLEKADCWDCKSKEKQDKILRRIFDGKAWTGEKWEKEE